METPQEENNDLISEQNHSSTVYTLDLSIQKLQEVPKSLRKYKYCKSLDLSCNEIVSIKKDDFSSCLQLKELKLYSNKLQVISGLQHLEKVEELHLQFNNITSIGISLKNNKNLTFLRLDSNKLSSIRLSEICMLSKLTYLDISSNKLDDIVSVNTLTLLERFYCTHNALTKLPNMFSLKKLKEVDFSCNDLINVSGLKGCNKLQVIVLNCNKINDLISIGSLKTLHELKVCDNFISDLKHITEQFNGMEVLEISGNKVDSLTQVRFLLNLSSTLRELSIYGNPMLIDNDQKTLVYDILGNNMLLDILDRNELHKEKTIKAVSRLMRPMSASELISQRSIENQMEFSAMRMAEFEDKIKLQFDGLKDLLMELPESKPKVVNSRASSCIQSRTVHENEHNEFRERPTSRCNSRARLDEARAFAEKHF